MSKVKNLRPLQLTDIPQVLQIERVVQPVPWSEGMLQQIIQADYHCWVVEETRTLLGFIISIIRFGECHILNISVSPAAQRQGIGRALLQHVLQISRNSAATKAFLEVRASNFAAIQLYKLFGFELTGIRQDYYYKSVGQYEDALVFTLLL